MINRWEKSGWPALRVGCGDGQMDVYLEGGNHLSRPMKNFLGRAAGQNISLNVLACRDRGRAIRLFGQTSSSDQKVLGPVVKLPSPKVR